MKKLLIILLFFTTGFEHVSVLKNTFGYIKAFYKVKTKIVLDCNDCYLSIDDTSKLMQVNEVFANNPYMSSTAFIVSQTKDETVLTTSGHVCEEIILFTTELKFKKLGIELQENIIKNNDTFKDKSELYFVDTVAYIYSFSGEEYKIKKIIAIDKEKDLCVVSTYSKWGEIVEFASKACEYEEIYNMSTSGGQYYPNAVPLRKGFINNTIKKQVLNNKAYDDLSLYTLKISPGASGSAVFNKKGKVCGSVNIAYLKLDLSAGPSSADIIKFLEANKIKL